MSQQRNGIFAENLRLKVTGEPKNFNSVVRIPCQAGFKGKDTWVNRWVDVVWFTKNGPAQHIAKGDILFVSGRWQETEREYNGKKYEGREVLADSIEIGQGQPQPASRERKPQQAPKYQDDDLGPAFPSEAGGMDDVPFGFALVPLAALLASLLSIGGVA